MVKIYINNFEKEAHFTPKFKRVKYVYSEKIDLISQVGRINYFGGEGVRESKMVNRSECPAEFIIENNGSIELNEYKLILLFPKEIDEIKNRTRYDEGCSLEIHGREVIFSSKGETIEPEDNIFFSLSFRGTEFDYMGEIKWEFVSENFKKKGYFPVEIIPEFISKEIKVPSREDDGIEIIKDYYKELKHSQVQKTGCLWKINEQ